MELDHFQKPLKCFPDYAKWLTKALVLAHCDFDIHPLSVVEEAREHAQASRLERKHIKLLT